jgi:hypothetical protein
MLDTIRARALRSLIPPPRLRLSDWIEANIKLPEGVSALPGAARLWPYQTEIADAISDPEIERITLVKADDGERNKLLSKLLCRRIAQDHCRQPPTQFLLSTTPHRAFGEVPFCTMTCGGAFTASKPDCR